MKRKLELPQKEGRSKAFLELNPHLYSEYYPPAEEPKPAQKLKRRRRKVMNKTETMFARMLESQQARGEIVSYDFEGMSLRWGNDEVFSYTADFVVCVHSQPFRENADGADDQKPLVKLRFIEVKGAHIWPNDWTRFKAARDHWPNFEFQLWQYKQREWTQIA